MAVKLVAQRGPVTITRIDNWRRSMWDDDVPSRTGWVTECADHGLLTEQDWTYETRAMADGIATRHLRKHHHG